MLRRMTAYLGQYKKYALLAPLMVVLEVACELLLPRLMADIVDVGIAQGDLSRILRTGLLMLLLAAAAMVLGGLAARFAAQGGQGYGANLRRALFDRIQEFSFADIERFSSASLITRMTNDVNAIQLMVTMGIRILVRAPVMIIAALSVAVSIDGELALVLAAVVPAMALAIGLLMAVCGKLFQVMQERIDGLNATVQENLVAVRVVKAFVRAGYEKTKFARSNDALTQSSLSAVMRIILMQPIMMLAFNAATLGVLWLGGRQVMAGDMLIGDLSSFLSYIFQILFSVMILAMSLLQLTRAQACAVRICEVLDTQPQVVDQPDRVSQHLPSAAGLVEFRAVSFRYKSEGSGDDVLAGLTFRVEPGSFTAIVGGTGAGKSSLVHLIPRFYDVTGGSVLVDGLDVRDYPLEVLRGRIGMVLQNNQLFSGTIRENLLWGRADATEEEIVQAAKSAQAYEFITGLPDGFDTHIEQGGVNVSGGQKQRLCIARAILRRPAILILDDSTSAVDTATDAKLRRAFRRDLADTTVILIAQRISSVEDADHILLLDEGTVSDAGTHEELLARSAIYREIYESQKEGVRE